MVPATLNDWSYDVIKDLVLAGKSESDRHDFKLNLPDAKALTKLACAFANTYGGFFVVGISDRKKSHFDIEGIPPDKELFGIFQSKINSVPSILVDPPLQIDLPESANVVYVFEIKRSRKRSSVLKVLQNR